MKPRLESLHHKTAGQSFLCYEVVVPAFEFLWHYHPEYELTFITSGSGKRMVGDNYEDFSEGDLVLLDPLLPHTWVSGQQEDQDCRAIVIQFKRDFMEQLLLFPEMETLKKLLNKGGRGLQFHPEKNTHCLLLLEKIIASDKATAFALLLQILQQLSVIKSTQLTTSQYKPMRGNENQHRINKVFLYVQKEFKEKISIKKAASILHLSESAFCKFFKRTSGKTFSDYTNEIRIAHACQLLIETDNAISDVAFQCGFESLTYFNRVFLRKKKTNPGKYRKVNKASF